MEKGPVIYGTRGCLKLARVFPHVIGGTIILDGGQHYSAVELFASEGPSELKERWFPRDIKDAFALEHLDFLRSIETGEPMETNGDEGVRDLTCCYATLESSTLNHPVKVADVASGEVHAYQREIDEHYRL